MLKINDIITLTAEKLTYGGDCIARYDKDNFVIFIKNAVVGDVVKAKITSLNKNYAKAEAAEIITPSKHRTKPFCSLQNVCGSCQLQNYEYNFLIKQKQLVLEDIFKNIKTNILPFKKSPKTKEYRHKIQYPTRQTKVSKRVLIGYYKNNSHELVNIKYCPIQPDIINKIVEFIRENWKLGCYSEESKKGLLKNIIFRVNSSLTDILVVFVLNSSDKNFEKNKTEVFFSNLMKNFKEIKGCFVNFNDKNTNTILGEKTIKISGNDYIIENLKDKKYKIGATSFFQVNPHAASELFDIVKENVKENSSILDAYGGVGAIGIYLKEKVKSITLVEENTEATELAKENYKLNNIKNYEIYSGDAKKHFLNFEKEKRVFDYVILDPPRSGCEKDGLKSILKLAKKIIYVSCNPQTLRRDVLFLTENNFTLKSIQGVDLFPYTYHIETIGILENNNFV